MVQLEGRFLYVIEKKYVTDIMVLYASYLSPLKQPNKEKGVPTTENTFLNLTRSESW